MQRYFTKVPRTIQIIANRFEWTSKVDKCHLTFDDGPHPESTPRILDFLDENELKATFFIIGENAEKYPALFSEIRSRGHNVGNHGYRHLAGWRISSKQYEENVRKGAEISESTLFRPPYGQIGWYQYQRIKTDYRIIMWSIMPGDFISKVNAPKTMNNVNALISKGDIIVFHDNPQHIERCLSMLRLLQCDNNSLWTTLI